MDDIRLTFDDSEPIDGLNRIEKKLIELQGTTAATQQEFTDAFKSAERSVESFEQSLQSANQQTAANVQAVQSARSATQSWAQSIKQTILGQQIGGRTIGEWGQAAGQFATRIREGAAAIQGATIAQRVFNTVLKASGIGLLIAAVASLISYFGKMQEGVDTVRRVLAGFNAGVNVIINTLGNLGGAIVKVFSGDFSGAFEQAKAAVSGVGSAILDAASAAYELERRVQALRDETITSSVEFARQQNVLNNLKNIVDDGTQSIGKRIAAQKDAAKVEIDLAQKRFNLALKEQQIVQASFQLITRSADDKQRAADAEIKLLEAQKDLESVIYNNAQKERDLRKDAAEKRKKQLEDERNALEQLNKELEKLRLAALGEGLDADLLALNQKFDELVKTAQAGVEKYNEIAKRRGLTSEEQAKQQEFADLAVKIEEQRLSAITGLLLEYNQKQIDADKEAADRRKELAEREYKDTESSLKAQKALRDTALQTGEQQAEAYLLRLEQSGASEEKIQKARAEFDLQIQKARLLSELKFQQGLLAITDATDTATIEQVKANIAKILAEIGNVDFKLLNPKTGKPRNLLDLLGIDPKDQEGVRAIGDAIGNVFQSISAITDAQIEQQQKIIQAIDDRISKQEEAVKREEELAKQGLANDLALEKEKLVRLQQQREEAAKKEAAARKTALLLDTVQQVSSLITASANIFKSVSTLGPFGVPLAIGLIAAMFGAFTAAKIKAAKAAEVPKFRKGGKLGGHAHDDGGNAIYNQAGNIIGEVERDEWIIGSAPSREHDQFLHRLNRGEFKGLNLDAMLQQQRRYDDTTGRAAGAVREIENQRAQMAETQHWQAMRDAYRQGAERIVRAIEEKPEIAPWKGGYRRTTRRGNAVKTETIIPE